MAANYIPYEYMGYVLQHRSLYVLEFLPTCGEVSD